MSTPDLREKILPRLIEDEMRESFLDYSMSVIVQRALPDVRDGLKPVHRRILYAMHEIGLGPNRPYKKSATVVGEVLGKYHPHGDAAVYDSLVRMVQEFSMRYPLVDGQGNFGSVDGDGAAAYRYTEARLTRLSTELLADIEKETVDHVANFDDRLEEPTVLPARLPNLLVNGSSGIAVGMATNIPPHNLREVVDACTYLIDNPDAGARDLMRFIPGPDFPTAGFIYGLEGIRTAYETGRGRVIMRARTEIEETKIGKQRIIVTELPYMVNKARMIEQIAMLVREKKLADITDLRDESDRDGIRVVIELRRDAIPDIVLNQLFKHTQLQATFGMILLALVRGVPRVLTLPDLIRHFIEHRHEVVVRRSEYDLREALAREHILEGWKIAVDAIDAVVELIKSSEDTQHAMERLQEEFPLSERQAKAILEMRLSRLTALEIEKLEAELAQVRAAIAELREILASRPLRMQIIKDELVEMAETFGDERRTEIVPTRSDILLEDLLANEEMVITVSHQGYIKRLPTSTYRLQRRGGRGLRGMDTKEEDWVERLFLAHTHDYLMFFTTRGRCYWLKVHEIPQAKRGARGKPIVNLIALRPGEQIAALVPVHSFVEEQSLLFCTRRGMVKKTALSAYGHVRSNGVNAIKVTEGDELISVCVTGGDDEVILATREGLAIRFHESDVRKMGRYTSGVRGIRLAPRDRLIGMVVVGCETAEDATLLVVSERGLGKRSRVDAYRLQHRAGRGVINIRTNGKTGKVVAIMQVLPEDELMLITRNGIINRQSVQDIRVIGRNTQGVRLLALDPGDKVTDVARLVVEDDEVVDELVEAGAERTQDPAPAEDAPVLPDEAG